MTRIATLLVALAVVGLALSGVGTAEQTDKRGQYAEANMTHFQPESQSSMSSPAERTAVGGEGNESVFLSPPIVAVDEPSDEVTWVEIEGLYTNHPSRNHEA
ncbi:hypothetical protein [Haladaptatus caseinilyticus]|uniref:hypothetical protein n=1 Tax=Haladaptatus caseinilyticus TaxID=2993314 RepID=UPI00224B6763|nr:hypothetical protein [Haladaptatus caseinilyticus]